MITALISAITGLLSGLLPEVLKLFQARQDQQHERAMVQLQIESEKVKGQFQLQEVQTQAMSDQVKAEIGQLTEIITQQSKPSGIKWIDGFNQLLRPLTAFNVMLLFSVFAYLYALELVLMIWRHDISAATGIDVFFGSMIGEMVQAVLGFLFGYRSVPAAKNLMSKVG